MSISASEIKELCFLPFEKQIVIISVKNETGIISGYNLGLELLWSLNAADLELVASDRKRRAIENISDLQPKIPKDAVFCMPI